MKKFLACFILVLITISAIAQNDAVKGPDYKATCIKFNTFYDEVLKGSIKKSDAQKQFDELVKQFKLWLVARDKLIIQKTNWVFPLQGYNYRATGGSNGNGYSDKGYRFLDGNRHGAHPAHDIFINDKNQDNLDDKTYQVVNVLAVDDGYVIACTNQWDTLSNLRGGRYIWLYHPSTGLFTYYAHNRAIFVKPGDEVTQGQKIAEVGRTGFNAFKKRSPTHLHFSTFKLADNIPVPYNSFNQLKKAVSK